MSTGTRLWRSGTPSPVWIFAYELFAYDLFAHALFANDLFANDLFAYDLFAYDFVHCNLKSNRILSMILIYISSFFCIFRNTFFDN